MADTNREDFFLFLTGLLCLLSLPVSVVEEQKKSVRAVS